MDLSFATDSRIWCLAIESLRAEHADLSDANVIKARYEQIQKNEVALSTTQDSSGALKTEVVKETVPETIEDAIADAAVATPRRKRSSNS